MLGIASSASTPQACFLLGLQVLTRNLLSMAQVGLNELPEIHQFLDGFYLSRIGIRILIGQHIALHEKPREEHIGESHYPAQGSRLLRPSPDRAQNVVRP